MSAAGTAGAAGGGGSGSGDAAPASAAAAAPAAPPAPAPIRQLPEAVVHRIAAGEVIQRPASALKEMLENSIDAGASRVSVTVKEGGLRLLQVADDGSGVARSDLPLLCVRHATSKLRAYEDLETIATLGFRGEALASISFVAHLSVTTMTRGAQHAWRASYQDGALLDPPGAKPCAGVPGTVLTVEDLFFNVPTRRKAFRAGGSEEGALILDLLQARVFGGGTRYAVWAAPRVGFTLRRQGESRADLATSPGASRLDVVRAIHGPDLAACLLPLAVSRGLEPTADLPADAPGGPHLRAEGFVTSLAWTGRRGALVLFINGRCVECGPLKRGAEAVYASLLPKGPKPWMFLDVALPPRQVEVNVHPTKREVGFLGQDEIVDAICRELEATLLAAMSSRTFATEAPPTAAATSLRLAEQIARQPSGSGQQQQRQQQQQQGASQQPQKPAAPPAYRPDKLVRADHRTRTMDAFVVRGGAAARAGGGDISGGDAGGGAAAEGEQRAAGELPASAAALAAVGGGVPRKRRAAEHDRLNFSSSMVAAGQAAAAGAAAEEGDPHDGAEEGRAGPAPGASKPPLPGGVPRAVRPRPNQAALTRVPAARALLAAREASTHEALWALVRQHVFVGLADEAGEWALLQHGTRLYLLAAGPLTADLFEQQLLRRWGCCPAVALAEPLGLREVAEAGLELEAAAGRWQPTDGPIPELAGLVAAILVTRAPLLAQAGITFDADGRLASLPALLEGYAPDLARLPGLVLALARDVDWEAGEDAAIAGVAAAVAKFYALQPLEAALDSSGGGGDGGEGGSGAEPMDVDGDGSGGRGGSAAPSSTSTAAPSAAGDELAAHRSLAGREWAARHVVFPAVKALLRPQAARVKDGSVLLLTSMERLYRTFERCG
ncbi:DNA mismatch repair protein [Raphidocelis subcapitata]|uniref:DNA mismatch repair protein n=1 Tax=Raphidocelis subcapitata TaxID=307507 RepID=A0A2V0PPI0_9CHLO|nr:DNA mismatch repair protein [Raphidocelis subcapitata]|eukprot:GBF99950.1 DNA mismatch repair protein [Raphidocelis subcapitata]